MVKLLENKDGSVQSAGASIANRLIVYPPFCDMIMDAVLRIFSLLGKNDPNIRSNAANAICEITEYSPFHDTVKVAVPQIIKLLDDDNPNVLSGVANAISKLAKYSPFHGEIRGAIPNIVALLKNNHSLVRSAGGNAIGTLAGHKQFHDELKGVVPPIVELLKDDDWSVRSAAAYAINNLAYHSSFHDPIKGLIKDDISSNVELIVQLLKDNDPNVRSAARNTIRKLIEYSEFHNLLGMPLAKVIMEGFLPSLPAALDFLSQLQSDAISLVEKSASFDVMTIFQHNNYKVAASSARLFCALTHHNMSLIIPNSPVDQFSCLTLDVILHALTCLDHPNGMVQACGTSILTVLVDDDHFRNVVSEVAAIRGFLGLFMKDISSEIEKLLHCLQELGLLQTL